MPWSFTTSQNEAIQAEKSHHLRNSIWHVLELRLCLGAIFIFINFWPCCAACTILVPWPGMEPAPPALEVWSLNHWTTRGSPREATVNMVKASVWWCQWSSKFDNPQRKIIGLGNKIEIKQLIGKVLPFMKSCKFYYFNLLDWWWWFNIIIQENNHSHKIT